MQNQSQKMYIRLNMPDDFPAIKAAPTEQGGVRDRFFAAKAELPKEINIIEPFQVESFSTSRKNTVFVAPTGSDSGKGTMQEPLATIQEALNRVRRKTGAVIYLRGGDYEIAEPIVLDDSFSGTEDAPFILSSYGKETPVLSCSKKIPVSTFSKLKDETMLARLRPQVRDKIYVADLKALGITEYGSVGKNQPMLLINNAPQTLARYPNENEPLIPMSDKIYESGGVEFETSLLYTRDIAKKGTPWEIGITDPRCLDWQWNDDIWIFGALYAEWAREYHRIAHLDRDKMSMTSEKPSNWGVQYDRGNNYYFLNIFEEIDVPGEWWIDKKTGLLYIYPPKQWEQTDDIRFASVSFDMLTLQNTRHTIVNGLTAGRVYGSCIVIEGGEQNLIQNCHIVGTKKAGVNIKGGTNNGCIFSTFEQFASHAVRMDGGDRANLIPAHNFVQNCTLKNPISRFGLSMDGCGNLLSHNYIKDTTIGIGGCNECVCEYNEIDGGDLYTHDSGMIYVAGGGLSACGNHFRYNYIHDFNCCGYGIYFDDLSRGHYAYGNVVVGRGKDIDYVGERCYNVHNGGEHCFFNNIAVDAGYFAFGGDISYYYDGKACAAIWPLLADSMVSASEDKRTERYLGRNPTYREFLVHLDKYFAEKDLPGYTRSQDEERLRSPYCNNYENNVIIRCKEAFHLSEAGRKTATSLETNFITEEDPGFYDMEHGDFRIKKDSEIFRHIPNFEVTAFERIGICKE